MLSMGLNGSHDMTHVMDVNGSDDMMHVIDIIWISEI